MKKNNRERKLEKSYHRYIYTLFSTGGRAALAVVTSILVPNALGPKALGTIAFGQIVVQNVRSLFDFNMSQTFFNLSASKRQSGDLTHLFVKISFVQIIISLIMLILLSYTKIGNEIIQGTPFVILLLLLGIEWVLYGVGSLNQLGDSKGISKWPQIIMLAVNAVMAVILIVLVVMKSLTIFTYLIAVLVFGILNFISTMTYLFQTNYDRIWMRIGHENLNDFIKSAMKISVPLTIVGYYGMGMEFIERFLIQYKYGPEEQSYFYIASKWASIIILFSTSSLQIFRQHLVENIVAGDIKKAGEIYLRLDGFLFYFTLAFALAWSFVGKEILSLLLGRDFAEAGKILVVMAIYPVSQVFGQMGTTVAIASGSTKEYSILTAATITMGLVISYFLLMPKSSYIPGLGLGSFGLAIKTAIFGLLAVQPITFLNCRYLSISYGKIMFQKVKIFLSLFVILLILTEVGKLFRPMFPVILESIARATLFLFSAATLLFIKPTFCGVNKNDIERLKNNPVFVRICNLYKK